MSTSETRVVTAIDHEEGTSTDLEVPIAVNGWAFDENPPPGAGVVTWTDPNDEHRYVSVEKTGSRSWLAFLRTPDDQINRSANSGDAALDRAISLMQAHDVTEPGSPAMPATPDEQPRGETVTPSLFDGSIRFKPAFTKPEADYRSPRDADFDASHDRCGDCVHFIEGGGCHLVQGDIDPSAYCAEFYADYGVFAHDHGDHMEVNAELISPAFDAREANIQDFVDEIEERLQQRRREATEGGAQVVAGEPGDGRPYTTQEKRRRLADPHPNDEWPGSWEAWESPMSDLPSLRNDQGMVIRIDTMSRGRPSAFVAQGDDERWRGLSWSALHRSVFRYMEDHPGRAG